jgi:hypothetical protein
VAEEQRNVEEFLIYLRAGGVSMSSFKAWDPHWRHVRGSVSARVPLPLTNPIAERCTLDSIFKKTMRRCYKVYIEEIERDPSNQLKAARNAYRAEFRGGADPEKPLRLPLRLPLPEGLQSNLMGRGSVGADMPGRGGHQSQPAPEQVDEGDDSPELNYTTPLGGSPDLEALFADDIQAELVRLRSEVQGLRAENQALRSERDVYRDKVDQYRSAYRRERRGSE